MFGQADIKEMSRVVLGFTVFCAALVALFGFLAGFFLGWMAK
jgi:hypothetical protein